MNGKKGSNQLLFSLITRLSLNELGTNVIFLRKRKGTKFVGVFEKVKNVVKIYDWKISTLLHELGHATMTWAIQEEIINPPPNHLTAEVLAESYKNAFYESRQAVAICEAAIWINDKKTLYVKHYTIPADTEISIDYIKDALKTLMKLRFSTYLHHLLLANFNATKKI